jgi:hypothetical protein
MRLKSVVYFLAAGCLSLAIMRAVPALVWVSPGDQTQSAFFRRFDPTQVVQSFTVSCTPTGGQSDRQTQALSSFSSSAGYHFFSKRKDVETHRTIERTFCADSGQVAAMMTSLHEVLIETLATSGCEPTGDRLTSRDGAEVDYRCGARLSGVALVHPPKKALGESDRDVVLNMQIDERWRVGSY